VNIVGIIKIRSLNIGWFLLSISIGIYCIDVFGSESGSLAEAYQEILSRFSEEKSKTEAYNVELNALSWKNPSPSLSDLNINAKHLPALIGDRIVLMMHPARTVDVPYYGEMIRWHNARFVTAITQVPLSANKLRQLIIDNDQKDGWKEVEPFVRETMVLYRDDKSQVGLRYKIQAKLSIIRVNGNIYARNRYEENGDISSLFLNGDIGVSLGIVPIIPKAVLSPLTIANVRRWEFIPIDDNRSYVAITDWAEVMNDTHLSKRMSQYDEEGPKLGGLSDEDLVGPFPSVAVNMYNFKNAIEKQLQLERQQQMTPQAKGLNSHKTKMLKGSTPDFIHQLPKQTLESVLQNGPVVFLHPRQEVDTDYGGYPLHFASVAYPVSASFEDMRRYSAQMDHYADYVPQLNASKLVTGSFEIPDFTKPIAAIPKVDVDFEMSLGKRAKFISSFNIEYRMRYAWERNDRLGFEAIDGEIETVLGAIEWLAGSNLGENILFYTSASDLGPNPKFPLSLSQKIPGADIASSVIVSTMAAGRQGPWIEEQLKNESLQTEVSQQPLAK
jgi:hypothetical protein